MIKSYYNLHDILKIKIEKETDNPLDLVEYEYKYFRSSNTLDNLDLSVTISDFQPSLENCKIINGKYYTKKDYIFVQERTDRYFWKIEIRDLDKEHTKVNFFVKYRGMRNLSPIFFSQNIFLRSLIFISLLKKDCILLHSSAVHNGNNATIFLGNPGVFKTTVALKLINLFGYRFLGEENVIVNKKGCYPYPFNYDSFIYKKNVLNFEKTSNFLDRIKLNYYVLSNFNKKIELPSKSYKISNFFYLKKSSDVSQIQNKQLSDAHLQEKGVYNEIDEISFCPTHSLSSIRENDFLNILNIYYYSQGMGFGYVWKKVNHLFSSIIKNRNHFLITSPSEYNDTLPVKINEIIINEQI